MYDNTCKFLAQNYSRDFSSWYSARLSLESIRADALIVLESNVDRFCTLLFQTEADPEMLYTDARLPNENLSPFPQQRNAAGGDLS